MDHGRNEVTPQGDLIMRYFKAAFRKTVRLYEDTEEPYVNTYTEIRPITSQYLTLPKAWTEATEKAIAIFMSDGLPLEWIQEIDQYEWETL